MTTSLPNGFQRTNGEAPLDITRLPTPPAWVTDALCAQVDNDGFYPEKGGAVRTAKDVCGRCEVTAKCLDYAIENDELHGIWGGKSRAERKKIARERAEAVAS